MMDMYRRLIAKYIGYPLQDYIRKTNILDIKKFLLETQYWDDNKIYEYRLKKLKKLIEYSYNYVPYYNQLFNKIGIKPNDIKKIDDLSKIPVLTKDTIYKEHSALISREQNRKNIKFGKTGGTTGPPIIVYKDAIDRTYAWASYYRWYEWMGLEMGDRVATIWGATNVLKKSLLKTINENTVNYLQNHIVIDAFSFSNIGFIDNLEKIKNFNPVLLKGYTSSLINIAQFLKKNRISNSFNLTALSTTSETLFPFQRTLLKDVFNTEIYDQYGCGEVSAISYECAQHNGLHINQEHVILEILDENNKEIMDEEGKVIATSLDNFVMPFIRYEIGDVAKLLPKKCNCGVNHPLMSSVYGRIANTAILKDGAKVHGVFFTDILYELGVFTDSIQRFQVYQEFPGEIFFRLETKKEIDKKVIMQIKNSTERFFNKVEIELHNHLPYEKNGKFLYIKNN